MLPYHQNKSSHRFSQEFSHRLRQHNITLPYDTIHSVFDSKTTGHSNVIYGPFRYGHLNKDTRLGKKSQKYNT